MESRGDPTGPSPILLPDIKPARPYSIAAHNSDRVYDTPLQRPITSSSIVRGGGSLTRIDLDLPKPRAGSSLARITDTMNRRMEGPVHTVMSQAIMKRDLLGKQNSSSRLDVNANMEASIKNMDNMFGEVYRLLDEVREVRAGDESKLPKIKRDKDEDEEEEEEEQRKKKAALKLGQPRDATIETVASRLEKKLQYLRTHEEELTAFFDRCSEMKKEAESRWKKQNRVNAVKSNIVGTKQFAPETRQQMLHQKAEQKREHIYDVYRTYLDRRQKRLEAKTQKVYRRELKMQQEKEQREREREIAIFQTRQKEWMVLSVVFARASHYCKLIQYGRSERDRLKVEMALMAMREMAVIRLQKWWRKMYAPIRDAKIARARRIIGKACYGHILRRRFQAGRKYGSMILEFLDFNSRQKSLAENARRYKARVVRIQRLWRNHVRVVDAQLTLLSLLWDRCIKKYGKGSSKKKKSKKGNEVIREDLKFDIIKNDYKRRRREHVRRLKLWEERNTKHLEERKAAMDEEASKRVMSGTPLTQDEIDAYLTPLPYPHFRALVTEEQMKELVQEGWDEIAAEERAERERRLKEKLEQMEAAAAEEAVP